jgi:NitT/TauT family transport system permease protein
VATLFVHNRRLQEIFFPVVVMFNSIPVVAKAPILVLIMGNGVERRSRSRAGLFLPDVVNGVAGSSGQPQALEMMRVLSASAARSSSSEGLCRVALLFSALRIAASMSVIGAVVGEWIAPPRASAR